MRYWFCACIHPQTALAESEAPASLRATGTNSHSQRTIKMRGKWIKWSGPDGSPLFGDHDMVAVRTRGGAETGFELRPWEFSGWRHTGSPNDILEYRVLPPPAAAQRGQRGAVASRTVDVSPEAANALLANCTAHLFLSAAPAQ
jgi:hypothetical protein